MSKRYLKKLRDPRWQKRRLQIMERDEWRCRRCGNDKITLHVHHIRYRGEPWEALDDDLETICETCHEEEHEIKPSLKRRPRLEVLPAPYFNSCQIGWLIKSVLPRKSVVLISGSSARLTTIDMCLSVATGGDWSGHPSTLGTVLIVHSSKFRLKKAYELFRALFLKPIIYFIATANNVAISSAKDAAEITRIAILESIDMVVLDESIIDKELLESVNTIVNHCTFIAEKSGATVVISSALKSIDKARQGPGLLASVDKAILLED